MKKLIYASLAFFIAFGLIRIYYNLTDDFRLANITYQLPFVPPWEVAQLDTAEHQHLKEIVNQQFSYIGKGAQCYAFASEDGNYVLKFFKFKHLKPNLLVEFLPPVPPFQGYKKNCIERKKRKLIGVFNGYDLAFKENRDHAALIYLHLIPTQNLHLNVTIIDKLGLTRTIHLDDVVFLIQKKGETLRTRLNQLLREKKLQEAKQAMASIVQMYISEYKKGMYDHDHGILHNTGFIGDKPFHLDVGKLNREDRMKNIEFYKADFVHVIWKMDVWIKANYPQFYSEFTQFLSQEYLKWTNDIIDLQSIDPSRFKKKRKIIGF